jgi:hypothetical protein
MNMAIYRKVIFLERNKVNMQKAASRNNGLRGGSKCSIMKFDKAKLISY